MDSAEIRRTFVDFFTQRDHRRWPSSSLIPNDPTLLLTVAGMVQFVPFFRGEATPPHPRATTVQKVARTLDIENVGVTTRHFTFFEMLGNFSFGDYFKADAIRWSWELSTAPPPLGFGFAPDRIWATIYQDDDEAEALWRSETDVNPDQIVRRGKADNFWSTGGAGPCGPCSELYYDRGPDHGAPGGPEADENRYLEFWNLVFMQFERDAAGEILGELPQQNVDTGMGLERMAMLLQDVPNAYEIDTVRPLLDRAVELTGVAYGAADRSDIHLRVIAEHARAASMLIADGVLPSNEARGYILRRLLRRAVRSARLLGATQPVMTAMTQRVIDMLGAAWPELSQQHALITRIAASEEEGFTRTLRTGMTLLEDSIGRARDLAGPAATPVVPPETAFALHDTFGFPIDLTVEIAAEQGLELDRDAFAALMQQQRDRARGAARTGATDGVGIEVHREAAASLGAVSFVGYDQTQTDTQIGALLTPGGRQTVAEEGDLVELVLPVTPFYAEGGGQLGDHGMIETDTGRLAVRNTTSPLQGLIVHTAQVIAGEVRTGQDAHARIDTDRRAAIARGHTATHILHATLKDIIGAHAAQAGSAIDAGRFRFDFPHFAAVSADQIAQIEAKVNARIAADPAIETVETSQTKAREMGATALFGEKYGDQVRVVTIGDYSRELCGGTHVGHTTEVGLFTILSEGSIAANLRRVEAVTGTDAFAFLSTERLVAEQVARMLKVGTGEVVDRVAALLERVKVAERAADQARQDVLLGQAQALLAGADKLGDVTVITAAVDGADRDGLGALAADLRNRAGRAIVVLGSVAADGSALLVAALSPDLGIVARDVLQPGARLVGGGAGGKGPVANAGGRDGTKLAAALTAARAAATQLLDGR